MAFDVTRRTWLLTYINRWQQQYLCKFMQITVMFHLAHCFILPSSSLLKFARYMLSTFYPGPRKCVGQGLAKMELFLFASNFLQHHSFRIPEGEPVPSTEGNHTGITLQPKPFHVVLQPRITKFWQTFCCWQIKTVGNEKVLQWHQNIFIFDWL